MLNQMHSKSVCYEINSTVRLPYLEFFIRFILDNVYTSLVNDFRVSCHLFKIGDIVKHFVNTLFSQIGYYIKQ